MTFRLMVDKRALDFLNSLDAKDQRVIKEKLKILQDNPYSGLDGDKEKLHTNKKRESYRLHVARSFTSSTLSIQTTTSSISPTSCPSKKPIGDTDEFEPPGAIYPLLLR